MVVHARPEIDAHRIIEDHIDERPVFERNVFTYWSEGRLGRAWEGPAFHRISADYALVNQGEVNRILRHDSVAGRGVCDREVLRRLDPPEPLPARTHPVPPTGRAPYRPNLRPVLLSRSSISSGPGGGEVGIELSWFERWHWDPSKPDRRGHPIRHGVRVCLYGPDDRRLHSEELISGSAATRVVLRPEPLEGRYVVQACSLGSVSGDAPLARRPCGDLILEVEFETGGK